MKPIEDPTHKSIYIPGYYKIKYHFQRFIESKVLLINYTIFSICLYVCMTKLQMLCKCRQSKVTHHNSCCECSGVFGTNWIIVFEPVVWQKTDTEHL
jgi:hypothetical protein